MLFLEIVNPPDAPLVTTGTAAAYAITPTVPITAYGAGQRWTIKPHLDCAADATLKVSNIATPPTLVKRNADGTVSNLDAGDLQAGWVTQVVLLSATQALVESTLPVEVTKLAQLQTGKAYTTTAGATSGQNYLLTPNPVLAANVENAEFIVEFHVAPTGAADLAVSGLAAVAMRYRNAAGTKTAFAGGEFPSSWRSRVVHDGTHWVVLDMPAATLVGIDYQVFTTSGTWTKPPGLTGDELVMVDLWGGGGGSNTLYTGGGGGAHRRVFFRAADLGSTEAVVVGAGGTTTTAGGTSSFNGVSAFGGGRGLYSTNYYGGNGGGTLSVGGNGPSGLGGAGVDIGPGAAYPALDTAGVDSYGDAGASGAHSSYTVAPAKKGGNAKRDGGGGGGAGINADGGDSEWGGGGGKTGTGAVGVSLFGGNGGLAPGGGGNANSVGARGEVRITVLR